MVVWSVVVMFLALVGIISNYIWGMPLKLPLHDIILFLIALGLLIRIRYKQREGEKEKLQEKLKEIKTKKG